VLELPCCVCRRDTCPDERVEPQEPPLSRLACS